MVGHLFFVVLEVHHDQKYVLVVLYDAARMDCCVLCLMRKRIGEICVYRLRVDFVEVDNAYCRVSQSLHCLGCVWVFYIMQWCVWLSSFLYVYIVAEC